MPAQDTGNDVKACSKCGKEQPLQNFYWRNRRLGKRRNDCRTCAIAAQKRRNSTPEGRARRREISAAYYQRNKEAHKRAVYRWRENNPDKIREIERRYYRNKPTKKIVNARRRRLERAVRDPELNEYAAIVHLDPCVYCGSPSNEIEHIVPLSRGGQHASSNIAAACRSCNAKKYNKSLLMFLLERSH